MTRWVVEGLAQARQALGPFGQQAQPRGKRVGIERANQRPVRLHAGPVDGLGHSLMIASSALATSAMPDARDRRKIRSEGRPAPGSATIS